MTPEEHLDQLKQTLIGQRVERCLLASNTLALDIGGSHETAKYVLWIDRTWHILCAGRVSAGSRQAQDEDDSSGLQAVGHEVQRLVERTIESFNSDPATGALHLALSGGFTIRTFAADPRDTDDWHLDDRAARRVLVGSSQGLRHEGAA